MTLMSKERLNEIKDVFVREHLPIRFAGLIDELFDEIRRLQSELAEQRKEIEATRERNNRLAHTMSEMVDAIDRKDKEIEELRKQGEAIVNGIDMLGKALSSLTSDMSSTDPVVNLWHRFYELQTLTTIPQPPQTMTKDQIKLIIHKTKGAVMNKHIGTIVGIFIVATLILMVSCNEKHPELNYPDSPLGLVPPPRPQAYQPPPAPEKLDTVFIDWEVFKLIGMTPDMDAERKADFIDMLMRSGTSAYNADIFFENVQIKPKYVTEINESGQDSVILDYQSLKERTMQTMSGCDDNITHWCIFRCGKQLIIILHVPHDCHCEPTEGGGGQLNCGASSCPSWEIRCRVRAR